jgi:hypothetical protein
VNTDDWKNQRFVRVVGDEYNAKCIHLIVMTDIPYWTKNVDDVVKWCDEHNCRTQGMTIEIPDDETYTLFCLRWG